MKPSVSAQSTDNELGKGPILAKQEPFLRNPWNLYRSQPEVFRWPWISLFLVGMLVFSDLIPHSFAQTVPPIVIPITKERVRYYRVSEDGSRITCGITLYGSFPVYKGQTNISDYVRFIPGVQNPGSWRLDADNRFRFTAWSNGSDSPAWTNPPCNHTIGEGLPEWHAEYRPKPPVAKFTHQFSESIPGEVHFTATSTDPEGDPITHEWNFGDGGTSSSDQVVHPFNLPGTVTVSLTARDTDTLTNRVVRTLTIPAPKPVISIRLLNKHSGNRIEIDEEFEVLVTVEATDNGVGGLFDLAFTDMALTFPDIFTLVREPNDTSIGNLLPGGSRKEMSWRLKAIKAGEFSLSTSSVIGQDAANRTVFGAAGSVRGEVTSLIVGIEQRPTRLVLGVDNNQDGKTNDLDMRLELIVGITNVSKQVVSDVKAFIVDDPIQLTSLAQDLNIWITPTEVPPGIFGTIQPGAANAVLRTNVYLATDRTYAEASILLLGKVGEAGVQVRGEGIVNVGGDSLLEARFDIEDRPYRAGQVVRVFGSLKNVSKFVSRDGEVLDEGKTIGVVVYPFTEGNGAGGYLTERDFGGRTPEGPTEFFLAPDEEKEIAAILPTAEAQQDTTLSLRYVVHAYLHGESLLPERVDASRIDIIEEDGGWSAQHTVSLAGLPPMHDPWLTCPTDLSFAGFVSCRLTEGLGNLSGGLADVGLLTAKGLVELAVAEYRMFVWRSWITGEAIKAILGDEAALARVEREILIDLQALQTVGVESLQGINLAVGSIGPSIRRSLDATLETLKSGDIKLIAGGTARIVGENIDLPLEALVAARSAKKALLMSEAAESVAKSALKEAVQKKSDELASVVDDFASRQSLQDLPTSDVLPTGVNVLRHPRIWRHAYGAIKSEIDAFLRIASEEGLLLAFRSRSPAASALIEAGEALLKPHGVSIKTVGELDVKFLKYPQKYEGLCALVSPPIPWSPRGFDRDLAVEKFLDRIPELDGSSPASLDLRNQVRERLHFQLDEWPKQVKNFKKYKNDGIDVDFYGEKNGLGFDDVPNENQRRGARLMREEVPPYFEGDPPRVSYLLEMEDAKGSGRFFPIAGDIDFIGMFKLDGSLPDLPARIRVYQKLRAAGLQHGESFTFYLKELRDKFLRCCSPPPFGENEKMLTATPDGQLITTQFRDELSIIEGGPNAAIQVGEGEFAFLEGVISEVSSAARPGTPVVPTPANFTSELAPMVTLSALTRSIGELDAVVDRQNGQTVRIGQDGMPEVYVAPNESATQGLNNLNVTLATAERSAKLLRFEGNSSIDAALDADLAGLVLAGYVNTRELTPPGAQGGRWIPISPEEIHERQTGETLGLAPYTYITRDVLEGATILPVFNSKQMGLSPLQSLFAVGDRVVLDPGGVDEEVASVLSMHPLTVSPPLKSPKQAGTMVLFLSGVGDPESTPGSLPALENLLVWLKADAGVELEGTNVVSWTDQSKNGFVFTTPTPTRAPAWDPHSDLGVPSVQFRSSQLVGNLGRNLTNATIFTLCRFMPGGGSSEVLYGFGTPNFSGLMMSLARRNADGADHYDGRVNRIADNTIPGSDFRVFTQVYGEGGADRHRLYVNQKSVLDTRTTTGRAYSAVATNIIMGTWITGVSPFIGNLMEWIIYDRVLTAKERLEVEEYLRRRAALSPSYSLGSMDLTGFNPVNFDISESPEAAWALDTANREAILTGMSDPSMLLNPWEPTGETIHLRIHAEAGSGAMGVVFGYLDQNHFQLFDWRSVTAEDSLWGIAPMGMRLRSFNTQMGQEPNVIDFWSGSDPQRVTTWHFNALPWVPGREYEVILHLGEDETEIEVRHGLTTLETWVVPELKGITGRFGPYVEGLPEARFGQVLIPGVLPVISDLQPGSGGNSTVQWMNGVPPFVVEFRSSVNSGEWVPTAPATFNFSSTFPTTEQVGFFRIRSSDVVRAISEEDHSQTFGNGGQLWRIGSTEATRIEAEHFDEGGQGVAYLDDEAANLLGFDYRKEAVDMAPINDLEPNIVIGWIEGGEWLQYSILVEQTGLYRIRVRTARGRSGSVAARFLFAGEDKTGNLAIPPTGNWGIYATTESGPFELSAGPQILRMDMLGGGFDLNWIEIVPDVPVEQTTYGNAGLPWLIQRTGATRIEAENFDTGGEGLAYHDTTIQNIGGSYREDGVDVFISEVGNGGDGGYGVGWMEVGEWLEYTIDVEVAGQYRLRANTARGSSGNRTLRFLIDGEDKTGNLVIPRTSNWFSFTVVESGVFDLTQGRHVLRADVTSEGFNLDWIELVPQ